MNEKSRHRSLGSVAVELALTCPLLVAILLGIVDLGRYVAIKAALTRGAREGLEAAVRQPGFDVDTRNLDYTNPADVQIWNTYQAAAASVLGAAMLKSPVFILNRSASSNSGKRLHLYSITEPAPPAGIQQVANDVLVLRPGDSATHYGSRIDHPLLCSGTGPAPCNAIGGMAFETALRDFPIVVEMRASLSFFTPFLWPIEVVGRATGYRELPPGEIASQTPSNPNNPRCGDSTNDGSGYGEECDDGNTANGDGCSSSCQVEGCGNGQYEPWSPYREQCDYKQVGIVLCQRRRPGLSCDPLTFGLGVCDGSCNWVPGACGNYRVDPGEDCDSGPYPTPGGGCDVNCRFECVTFVCGPGEFPQYSTQVNSCVCRSITPQGT